MMSATLRISTSIGVLPVSWYLFGFLPRWHGGERNVALVSEANRRRRRPGAKSSICFGAQRMERIALPHRRPRCALTGGKWGFWARANSHLSYRALGQAQLPSGNPSPTPIAIARKE